MGRNSSLYIVLGAITILSVICSILAISQLQKSGIYLGKEVSQFTSIGKSASVEDCVDSVLSWASKCEAIRGLCESSVSKMMSACLVSQNREDYCDSVGRAVFDSHFGFQKCYARGFSKRNKPCAEAYSTIGGYCLHVNGLAKKGFKGVGS